ncbi:MAG: hypothetical protein QM619_02330 [Micropruina sp.]|uniref:hypothetical protein n=1 Tax=Micropruina sp. TaxID=2737536 RepID=UPI0039E22BC3
MEFVFLLLVAAAGGFFGACVGGNFSFVITGFAGLAATAAGVAGGADISSFLFSYVAFGPFTGPHIAFTGAVAGSAYAAMRGYTDNGKDIAQPLARLGKVDVLLVAAGTGVVGWLLNSYVFGKIPWFGGHTDTVALTVATLGIATRFIFADRSLLNPEHYAKTGNKFAPHEHSAWIRYQETFPQLLTMGIFPGLLGASIALLLAVNFPGVGMSAAAFPWAISAITIFFLNIGYNSPVTHHMTIIGGLGAIVFYPILAGQHAISAATLHSLHVNTPLGVDYGLAVGAILIGTAFATLSSFLGEASARLFQSRGKTHIDPPAVAIFLATTLIWIVAAMLGASN